MCDDDQSHGTTGRNYGSGLIGIKNKEAFKKPSSFGKKIMMTVWWTGKTVVHIYWEAFIDQHYSTEQIEI